MDDSGSVGVVDRRAVDQMIVGFQRCRHLLDPGDDISGHGHGVSEVAGDLVEQLQIPAKVGQGDHREPEADQCVVRVVPFRPLRVHPDATVWNEVRQFAQGRDEELLE